METIVAADVGVTTVGAPMTTTPAVGLTAVSPGEMIMVAWGDLENGVGKIGAGKN
ncbi:MAG: hypothetical protein AB1611_19450 [bacterium]